MIESEERSYQWGGKSTELLHQHLSQASQSMFQVVKLSGITWFTREKLHWEWLTGETWGNLRLSIIGKWENLKLLFLNSEICLFTKFQLLGHRINGSYREYLGWNTSIGRIWTQFFTEEDKTLNMVTVEFVESMTSYSGVSCQNKAFKKKWCIVLGRRKFNGCQKHLSPFTILRRKTLALMKIFLVPLWSLSCQQRS